MSRQQVLQLGIAILLVILFLVGCGAPAATPVSEAPTATSTPEPAVATPTPIPPTPTSEPPTATLTPEPPTVTPTPVPPTETPTPAIVKPQPGVTLTGEIKESKTADSATIDLKISEDGTSLTQVDVTIINLSVECSVDSSSGVSISGASIKADSTQMSFTWSFPITEGIIEADLPNGGKLQGKFTSPTEASGTINIIRKEPTGVGVSMLCDFGVWEWSAKAK